MTRGRSKDLNIPTSRALIHQRDYRARKAKYLLDLEERCRRAEVENEKLRRELELARKGLPVRQAAFNSETARATTELMQHLSAASASLARFQQLTFTESQPLLSNYSAPTHNRPSLLPSPPVAIQFSPTATSFYSHYDDSNSQSEIPKPAEASYTTEDINDMRQTLSESPKSDEECCGGFIDCDLAEEEPHETREKISNPLVNDSNIRSTSDTAPAL